MPRPIPLALGLIRTLPGANSAQRSRARVQMGAFAFREGYALAETFEVNGEPVRDEAAYRALMQLAARCSISVLLAADDVPTGLVTQVRRTGVLAVMLVPRALVTPESRSGQALTVKGEAVSQTRSKLAR